MPGPDTESPTSFLDSVQWRLVGPFRGGRSVAVTGDPANHRVFYFGAVGGGVWKTVDAGHSWRNVSDGYLGRASVGAVAVAPSDPNVVYAGMGECCIRSNVAPGDGVYRSDDAGATWNHLGLEDTRHISRVRVHPRDADLVYVAALGHVHGPNDERGIYRSHDGGRHWERILHAGPDVGAADLAIDPHNPRILYAALWRTRRRPWRLDSGGEGSGLWRSTDGGDTWTDISHRPGLPTGVLGRIGVSPSPARPGRLWAIVEAADGAVFRSDDHGDHWERLSEQGELRWRAWYYHHVFAHPTDADTVWVLATEVWRSTDGGRTFDKVPAPHPDTHDLWFDPADPARLILGCDGGAAVSFDDGVTWSSLYNQPTAELYHVAADTRTPYRVYACQQDNTSIALPTHSVLGTITALESYDVGGGESGHIAVRPDDPDVVYAGEYQGYLTRYDHRRRDTRVITAWPELTEGAGAEAARYRFNWTSPVLLSPHDPDVLYHGGNRVFRSRDEGQTWEPISPDLSRNDPDRIRSSGGDLTADNTGAEYYCTVFALAESSVQAGVLWAGTDDGLVHVSTDAGATWREVTPPGLPEWAHVSCIEPSPHEAGTAYVVADAHRLDDFHPYVWRTRDLGSSWERLDAGLGDDDYCHVVREDPATPDLLVVGTSRGVFLSYDGGRTWAAVRGNLPVTPVHDLLFKDDDLVAATHGRSIWILEDLPAVREHRDLAPAPLRLYTPRTLVRYPVAWNMRTDGPADSRQYQWVGVGVFPYDLRRRDDDPGATEAIPVSGGRNRPNGVAVLYWLDRADADGPELSLTFRDESGTDIRTIRSHRPDDDGTAETDPAEDAPKDPTAPRRRGLNRFVWDTRHDPGTRIETDPPKERGFPEKQGPPVPPGRYQVVLRIGDQEQSAWCTIANDPTSPASVDDLRQHYALGLELWRRSSDICAAINTARSLRRRLEPWQRDDDEEIARAARDLTDALSDVEDPLLPVRPQGSRRLSNPPGLYDQYLALSRTVEAAHCRPTAAMVDVAASLSDRLDQALAAVATVVETQLASFNELLRAKSIPAVAARGRA